MKQGARKRGRTGEWRLEGQGGPRQIRGLQEGNVGTNFFGIFPLAREISPYPFLLPIYIRTLEISYTKGELEIRKLEIKEYNLEGLVSA